MIDIEKEILKCDINWSDRHTTNWELGGPIPGDNALTVPSIKKYYLNHIAITKEQRDGVSRAFSIAFKLISEGYIKGLKVGDLLSIIKIINK